VLKFITKWFGKNDKKPAPAAILTEMQTAPLTDEQLLAVSLPEPNFYPPQILVGAAQSVGKQRDHNEDALYTLSSVVSDGDRGVPFGIFIVADGMGGHMHGEIASGTAARAVGDYLVRKVYPRLMGQEGLDQSESLQEIMESAVREAQQAVIKRAPGGGTTLTAALVLGEQVTIAHVGDSRAYFLYPDGRNQVVTMDHSLVRRLVDLGQLTEEQARVYPQKNVLYRAIGQAEPFRPDIQTHQIPRPGSILLCSDGLWGVVRDEEIFNIVKSAGNLAEACRDLVNAANQAGGPDNISVVIIQYIG
jgi:PPM family protein phosphatase